MSKFREPQIRAALLRIQMTEAFTASGSRPLTQEEVSNYYGDGSACPRDIWPFLKDAGLITFVPSRLTDEGRAWLISHPKRRILGKPRAT